MPLTNFDLYLALHLECEAKVLPVPKIFRSIEKTSQFNSTNSFSSQKKTKLLYYVNKLTGIYCLYIFILLALDIFAIAYGKRHPGFSLYYKIITRFWFI